MYSLKITYTERDAIRECTEEFDVEEKARSRAHEIRKQGLWHKLDEGEVLIPPEHIHRIILDF